MINTRALLGAAAALAVVAVMTCTINHAPGAPDVPSGPEYCLRDTTYTFKTVATDPDGDSVAFHFDWGDSTTSHWVGWFANGETVAFTHAWSDTGTYEVRVSAQDRQLSSDPSDGLLVQVAVRLPPGTPEAPLGVDFGSWDSSYDFTAGADHPEGIPVAIRFAWGDGDTSGWSDFVLSGEPVSASHRWSNSGPFAVTAQAKDTGELTSPWSAPHFIVVHQPYTRRLRMVGAPYLTSDSAGFLVKVINDGTAKDTINWLAFFDTPDSAYMRDFRIEADRCGYPLPNGQRGTGPGDTVHFTAPVTIAPNGTQMIEVEFLFFFDREVFPPGTPVKVAGRRFVFRFSDGSLITVNP